MRWVCATVAPWALGAGLLVSFTASAGHDLQAGASLARLGAATLLIDASGLIPPSSIRIGASPRLPVGGLVREARLRFDLPEEAEQVVVALPPRGDLKAQAADFPSIDRSRKGDPIVALRPSLSHRAGDLRQAAGRWLLFEANDPALPATGLKPGSALPDDLDGEPALIPWQSPDPTMTRQAP
jgi:hypothetical protein